MHAAKLFMPAFKKISFKIFLGGDGVLALRFALIRVQAK